MHVYTCKSPGVSTSAESTQAPQEETVGDDSLFLTVDEAASMLRISRRHLYELIAEGTVRAVRLGRRTIVPRAVIEELAAA